jgi:hypothetical protein
LNSFRSRRRWISLLILPLLLLGVAEAWAVEPCAVHEGIGHTTGAVAETGNPPAEHPSAHHDQEGALAPDQHDEHQCHCVGDCQPTLTGAQLPVEIARRTTLSSESPAEPAIEAESVPRVYQPPYFLPYSNAPPALR